MLRPSSVICSVLPRKAIVGLFATFASIVLLPCAVAAAADSYSTGFESPTFTAGTSVNGQDHWAAPPQPTPPTDAGCGNPSPYSIDQGIVTNGSSIPGFGSQSLRFSNLCPNGAFGNYQMPTQMYSPPVTPAGEDESNTVFTYEFSFISTVTTYQPGLNVSVSPDDGSGGRMLRVDLMTSDQRSCGNSTWCVVLAVADAPTDAVPFGYPVTHDLAWLDPAKPHTIKVSMKFNHGLDNDLVRVSIDQQDSGQCFASWENYYHTFQSDIHPTPPVSRQLEFRSRVPGFTLSDAGFLFDNVSYSSSDGPGPQGCDEQIEKQADSPTVTAGGIEGYRLTVRNRGRLSERNLLLCDHVPNHTTFVSADHKLRRLGRRRCLLIPRIEPGHSASVHLMLRVNATAPPGNLDNIADITPVPPRDLPAVPQVDLPPGLPPSVAAAVIKPIARAKVIVKILRAVQAARPPAPPPVTG